MLNATGALIGAGQRSYHRARSGNGFAVLRYASAPGFCRARPNRETGSHFCWKHFPGVPFAARSDILTASAPRNVGFVFQGTLGVVSG